VKYRFRTRPAYLLLAKRATELQRSDRARLLDRRIGATFPATMIDDDPIARFGRSFARAVASEPFDASRAALATADARGRPSVRFVLVKDIAPEGVVVYTNLQSRKAREVAENPWAALAFHWSTQGEQVRIEGPVEPVSEAEADAYFASRPRGSQLGAWASPQSQPVASREFLEARVAEVEAQYATGRVPRPPFWSGLRIVPQSIEFWYDRPDRLHDRFLYTREAGGWSLSRLSP
jgi:pyridoxamine 5'-phosphate oxidase